MQNFFGFLSILSVVLFVVGMISPKVFTDKKTGQTLDRKNIALGTFTMFMISLAMVGVLGDDPAAPVTEQGKPASAVAEKSAAEIEQEKIKAAEAEAKCKEDLQCWGDKHSISAAVYCEKDIERLAKYSFKWTDGFLEPKFSRFMWHDKDAGTVTYIGDKIEYQNGFGAFQNHIYQCDFDPVNELVLEVKANPGRL